MTPSIDIDATFRVLNLNVCGFYTHSHLIDALVSLHDFPEFVALTETHLSKKVKAIKLSNYELVSRRDRPDQRGYGGVALFARHDVHENIVLIKESPALELTWHTLHSDIGPLLLGVWYRPPNRSEIETIRQFDKELEAFDDHVGKLIVGDMNVHNNRWLTFSNGVAPEGHELEAVCASHGLSQRVKGPTRGEHLLDLVLTDLAPYTKCKVVPGILENDHDGVLVSVSVKVPSTEQSARECFDFGKAKWGNLRKELAAQDWKMFFHDSEADAAAERFTEFVLDAAKRHIPTKKVMNRPYKHPWIDDDCRELLRKKHEQIGQPGFVAARDACLQGFRAAQAKFLDVTRKKLKQASSKDWWRESKELLSQSTGRENIPPLQSKDVWAKTPAEKADLLSDTFVAKARLCEVAQNEFTEIEPSGAQLRGFLRLRVRAVLRILKDLDENSGTGPDLLPTMILRRCAKELALPVTLLSRICLNQGRWPQCWRFHWIHPLHKKKSKADPLNYRGVHLTPQLAKVVERAIGSLFVPWLSANGFGDHQYAYSKNKSHRDVLAINVCCWLLLLEEDHAIGLYCSDVSGAFDRVSHERLGQKLRASGLPNNVVVFLQSWLEDRLSSVVVGGAFSSDTILADSVFQGTVLGPPLWNTFYADASRAIRRHGFIETIFADDFNCWVALAKSVDEVDAVLILSECQYSLHAWGAANQVSFDPLKESFAVLRREKPLGELFRLLGVKFDTKLLMHEGAREVSVEAGWRLQSILKARRFFSTFELVRLYKSLVLSFIESGVAGYYHAAPSVLHCIDRVQLRMLRETGLTEEDALLKFNLLPLAMRRDIGILGLLHRVNLGLASKQMAELFPPTGPAVVGDYIGGRVRGATAFHTKQLLDRVEARSSEQFRRSMFGMVRCYNVLPQNIVDAPTTTIFQRSLQDAVKARVRKGDRDWRQFFEFGRRYASVLRFQALFRD